MTKPLKKKILVFIDWYLPGYKAGGPVRSMANMVAHLGELFDFYIVTRNTEYGEKIPYDSVKANAWNELTPGVKVWYAARGNASLRMWRRLMRQTACDVVYINGIYSPLFSLLPLLAARSLKHPRVIVAPRGMLAGSAINLKRGKKELFLKVAHRVGLYKKVHWHVTNGVEANQVSHLFGTTEAMTIAANLPRKELSDWVPVQKNPGSLRICSLARIAPEKNTLYAIRCLQPLSDEVQVELDLFGQIYNKAYWGECLEAINQLPPSVKVTHKGFVSPEKINDTLKMYHLLFLPSRGENFGHVILESIMAGRPVLISDQTPWRDLAPQKAGLDLPLSDPNPFAEAITRFAQMDQKAYDEWSVGALELGKTVAGDQELVGKYRLMLGEEKLGQ